MDKDEILERYKELPLYARLLLWAVIGIVPCGYYYLEDGVTVEARLDEAEREAATAKQSFFKASQQKKNLPKLEEELQFTEEELEKARRQLPDSFKIDEILQKTATIAREVGVSLYLFDPQNEVPAGTSFRYIELPISAKIKGKFSQVGMYFDRIVHLNTSVFIRDVKLIGEVNGQQQRAEPAVAEPPPPPVGGNPNQAQPAPATPQPRKGGTDFEIAQRNRENMEVAAEFKIVIFRGLRDDEFDAPAPSQDASNAVNKAKETIAKINGNTTGF